MKFILTLSIISILMLSACTVPKDTNQVFCTMEAKLCPDGITAVGRNASNNCAFDPCPQTNKKYIGNSLEQCKVIKFACENGMQYFSDDKGCGCEPIEGKLQAYDCTQRTQACTKEYNPVCGQVQVECIRAPCGPVKETFGNACMACANNRTISYTMGACSDAVGGTVLAGTAEEQCVAFEGKYVNATNECEGISESVCTELGGTFNACASACRNDPKAEVCTLQCVPVCKLG